MFAFGNLIGETGAGTVPRVDGLDVATVRQGLNTTAGIDSNRNFNRDGRTNALDLAAARQNLGRSLGAPATSAGSGVASVLKDDVERTWIDAEGVESLAR